MRRPVCALCAVALLGANTCEEPGTALPDLFGGAVSYPEIGANWHCEQLFEAGFDHRCACPLGTRLVGLLRARQACLDAEGLGHGRYLSWHLLGGPIAWEHEYVHGVKHGWSVTTYENNHLFRIAHYRSGKLDGSVMFFHEDGRPRDKLVYCDGAPCRIERLPLRPEPPEWLCDELHAAGSEHRCACPEGTRFEKIEVLNGRPSEACSNGKWRVRFIEWSPDGTKYREERRDLTTGEGVRYRFARGSVSEECQLSGRFPNGPCRRWYRTGALDADGTMCDGRWCGLYKEYSPDGVLWTEGRYTDAGKKHGLWRERGHDHTNSAVCYQLGQEVWRVDDYGWEFPTRSCP